MAAAVVVVTVMGTGTAAVATVTGTATAAAVAAAARPSRAAARRRTTPNPAVAPPMSRAPAGDSCGLFSAASKIVFHGSVRSCKGEITPPTSCAPAVDACIPPTWGTASGTPRFRCPSAAACKDYAALFWSGLE